MEEKLFSTFEDVSYADWNARTAKDLKGKAFEEYLLWAAEEGLKIPAYADHAPSLDAQLHNRLHNTENPGLPPRHWFNAPYFAAGEGKATNEALLASLNQGAEGVWLDLRGTKPSTLPQYLADFLPEYAGLYIQCEAEQRSEVLLALQDWLNAEGKNPESVQGAIFADDFGDISSEILDFSEKAPRFFPLGVLVPEAGKYVTGGAQLLTRVKNFLEATDSAENLKKRFDALAFSFAAKNLYFVEIAGLRALRLLLLALARAYNLQDLQAEAIHFHARVLPQTGEEDVYQNMLSNTTRAMSAVLGGVQGLTVYSHTHGTDDEKPFAARIARNVSTVLREEAHLDKVADPVAGSWYIGQLTEQLTEKIWEAFVG